jgi:KDO2-lipid IV(A) lauroyltransferase
MAVITYLGFRLIEGAIARLPRRLAYALGVIVSTLAFPLLLPQRRALESNLRRVRPELSVRAVRRLAWRNWLNHTKAWIDFFKVPRMKRERLASLLTAEPQGLKHLNQAMARGKGVIVVAPHMGSWELACASWASAYGEIGVMVEQIEPRQLFDHVFAIRSRMGIRVIPLSRTAARDILRMLRAGRMVVLAMDRDILRTGRKLTFFGEPASFPTGPVELALKTGAPLFPAYCIRDGNDRYYAMGGPAFEVHPSGDHDADVKAAMENILATFERYIRRYPDQWHVLEPIWTGQPAASAVGSGEPQAVISE